VNQRYTYVQQNRIGDHICYYSDLRKTKSHYPNWSITKSLPQIIQEISQAWKKRVG
jgi:CDP-paratose 2-epimerase